MVPLQNKMPVLFIGHGTPMNVLIDNEFTQEWKKITQKIPQPKGILSISAHWETMTTKVTAMTQPRTIHDFYGFPPELYQQKYPAPGNSDLAKTIQSIISPIECNLDYEWGLDHGTWVVLSRMYPNAKIPTIQLSIDRRNNFKAHYELGKKLNSLRNQGILIIGSGNIVHNFDYADFDAEKKSYPWGHLFIDYVKNAITSFNHQTLIQPSDLKSIKDAAIKSISTQEHYIPLLYTLGCSEKEEKIHFFNDRIVYGAFSMLCIQFGE
jgi:4,5-DOPA dioxygenase extradiol